MKLTKLNFEARAAYSEAEADLPKDVDDGHVEVTGQEEILSRRRQKLVNKQICLVTTNVKSQTKGSFVLLSCFKC